MGRFKRFRGMRCTLQMLKLQRLIHLVLFLALAICQVPGSVVGGRCEMACCKPEITAERQLQEKNSCCCASIVVHKHVDNDAASSTPVSGDVESVAISEPIRILPSGAVLRSQEPIPHAQGPPGRGVVWLPPTRAPPVSWRTDSSTVPCCTHSQKGNRNHA